MKEEYTDTGLTPNTTYYYCATAYNSAGNSNYWSPQRDWCDTEGEGWGTTASFPPVAVPGTYGLYLPLHYTNGDITKPWSNYVEIHLPDGSVISPLLTITGDFTISLQPTDNPNIASIGVVNSSLKFSGIKVQGTDFGEFTFTENPASLSTGTFDLTNGAVNITLRILVSSTYLNQMGLQPVPIETHLIGVFPFNVGQSDWLVGAGTIPSYVPYLGGGTFAMHLTAATEKSAEDEDSSIPRTQPWEGQGSFKVDKLDIKYTISKTDGTIIITFIGTGQKIVLELEDNRWLIDPHNGFITFHEIPMTSTKITNTDWNLWHYGKTVVLDAHPNLATPKSPGYYDYIVLKKRTYYKADGTIDTERSDSGYKVDTPTTPGVDPTFKATTNTDGSGGTAMRDSPGTSTNDFRPRTEKVRWDFYIWVINVGADGSITYLGFYKYGFTLTITYGGTPESTTVDVAVDGPAWTGGQAGVPGGPFFPEADKKILNDALNRKEPGGVPYPDKYRLK